MVSTHAVKICPAVQTGQCNTAAQKKLPRCFSCQFQETRSIDIRELASLQGFNQVGQCCFPSGGSAGTKSASKIASRIYFLKVVGLSPWLETGY